MAAQYRIVGIKNGGKVVRESGTNFRDMSKKMRDVCDDKDVTTATFVATGDEGTSLIADFKNSILAVNAETKRGATFIDQMPMRYRRNLMGRQGKVLLFRA